MCDTQQQAASEQECGTTVSHTQKLYDKQYNTSHKNPNTFKCSHRRVDTKLS